jgi:hypothetical protein
MDKQRIKQLARNPQFIPGIFNYCDRWCERCPFTARCLNFALSEEQFAEPESRDIYNKLFWQRLSEMFRLTREMLQDTLEMEGINLEDLEDDAEEDKNRRQRSSVRQDEAARAARAYGNLVDAWFEANSSLIQERRQELRDRVTFEPADASHLDQAAGFEDVLEILRWYQHQIYVKLMRAISGRSTEDMFLEDEVGQKDSDGSAKVALIGLDRSIAAWMALRDFLPERKDDLIDVLVQLDRLRRQIEHDFPQARAFVRPGFDEVQAV